MPHAKELIQYIYMDCIVKLWVVNWTSVFFLLQVLDSAVINCWIYVISIMKGGEKWLFIVLPVTVSLTLKTSISVKPVRLHALLKPSLSLIIVRLN